MANRRMISKSISVSDETNTISTFAALLFTWMIPHTDDYGIIHGTAGKIKGLVVPRRKENEKQVEDALVEMQQVGLIYRFIYKNESYIQFCKFEEHQEGLHKRTAPKHPIYLECCDDEENFRELPGNSPIREPNRREPNRREKEGKVFGEAQNVILTDEEYQKLVEKFQDEIVDKIERLSLYKKSKGIHYKSDYATILCWARKDADKTSAKARDKPKTFLERSRELLENG
jgi:hypothetical protein